MNDNIADTLDRVALLQGDRVGIIEARTGRRMSFRELNQSANQYAAYLTSQGVSAGERLMLMVRPSADFISLTFALFRIGVTVILIDPGMGYKNMLRCIAGVKPDYLVGIPLVVLLSSIMRKPFKTIKKRFCCGSWFGFPGRDISNCKNRADATTVPLFRPSDDSLAAIIFTTGSTGPPKGVRYQHRVFSAQLRLIREYYHIGPGDIDQPGFPLFALFSTALGATAVIPDMNPSKPAMVDPQKFVASIDRYQVTYSFGSPAIWNVVSRYCLDEKRTCRSLKKVLMAGAPVSGELIDRVFRIMGNEAEIYTPYGATESLPIVSIEGKEIITSTWDKTIDGSGTCVGKALPGIKIKVIQAVNIPIPTIAECHELPAGEIGEIIVSGDVVTSAYENNDTENLMSKIADSEGFWHRLGDVGYLDDQGRLWFCGRKAHCVKTRSGTMYTICCEAIPNNHPDVCRSALVGINPVDGYEQPALIIELKKECDRSEEQVLQEVQQLTARHPLTSEIETFLVHPSFPVDIRHNAKIFREKLKIWAQQQVGKKI